MFGRDRELAKEFNEKLSADSTLAGDPGARLEFFLRRHESWDERVNLYPICRKRQQVEPGR